ncbi:predicted protein [Histoplasma mississippiense (nom. inval.)]|uniref:predicted protein n=1 Tax=Ajellomyces capsulatus (strain NAm1 / WU24) TaxID=2059318 RepID=UPI000157C075|nr:predicted protein [Histoplasma mississippiense (nom. inval.)]EDN07083.1 predicted protein [Histoplasma mississippiense (nom. inval.)]
MDYKDYNECEEKVTGDPTKVTKFTSGVLRRPRIQVDVIHAVYAESERERILTTCQLNGWPVIAACAARENRSPKKASLKAAIGGKTSRLKVKSPD